MRCLLCCLVAISVALSNSQDVDTTTSVRRKCLYEPPYLYVTTHDEVPNVMKYTRDGCLVTAEVLADHPAGEDHITEFRSMALGGYRDLPQALFIADAMSKESFLLVYSECDANGHRHYLDTVVSTETNPGADHAYGICFDGDGNVLASFQHTDCVLRFRKDTFEPMPLPPLLSSSYRWQDLFAGTFYQFGSPGLHPISEQGVRGIVRLDDMLWIANEDIGGVAVVSLATGMMLTIVVVHNPIGLHHDPACGLIFVGSKRKHWRGAVHAIDPKLFRVVRTYTTNRMNHPAGITSYGDMLYVGEQVRGDIMQFSIASQEFLGNVVSDAPGEIEQLIMSPC